MLIPTGHRTFLNSATGTPARVLGAGDMPVNFLGDDEVWSPIELRWETVSPTRWRAVQGDHRVIVDSTVGIQFSKRDVFGTWHRLGMQPRRLIKFNIANRTWDTLAQAASPLVSINAGTMKLSNVFPDVHCELEYFNNSFSMQWVFTQAAREALKSAGPWAGHAIGIATELDPSQMNVQWRDESGDINPALADVFHADWIDVAVGGACVFALPPSVLQHAAFDPLGVNNIPVRKFVGKRDGTWWLVEMFDPIAANALPSGDLWHHATFGEGGTPGTYDYGLGDLIASNRAAPSSNGTATSITYYCRGTGGLFGQNTHATCALYTDGSPSSYYQETNEVTFLHGDLDYTVFHWQQFDFGTTPSVVNGTNYNIAIWGEHVDASSFIQAKATPTGGYNKYDAETYATPLSWPALSSSYGIIVYGYCTYTEAGGAVVPQRTLMGVGT